MSDGKQSKSISATRQEWEEIDLESRMHGMSRSQYLLKIWRCYQKGEAMHTQEEDIVMKSILEATESLGVAKAFIERRIETQQKIILKEEPEVKKMIREVRTPQTKSPIDIEPQHYKPSKEEMLDYVRAHPGCTVRECSDHYGAYEPYVKLHMGIFTDSGELTVKVIDGNEVYRIGDGQ